MTQKKDIPICVLCKSENMMEGTLEGISFQPSTEKGKWLTSGIYGIKAYVCMECGCISKLHLDVETLNKLVAKAKKIRR